MKKDKVGRFWDTVYTMFHKKPFFHNSLKWWSIYTKFLPIVTEEILIKIFQQNVAVD